MAQVRVPLLDPNLGSRPPLLSSSPYRHSSASADTRIPKRMLRTSRTSVESPAPAAISDSSDTPSGTTPPETAQTDLCCSSGADAGISYCDRRALPPESHTTLHPASCTPPENQFRPPCTAAPPPVAGGIDEVAGIPLRIARFHLHPPHPATRIQQKIISLAVPVGLGRRKPQLDCLVQERNFNDFALLFPRDAISSRTPFKFGTFDVRFFLHKYKKRRPQPALAFPFLNFWLPQTT